MTDDTEAGRDVVSMRVLDAPRPVVFRAFSDAAQLVQWWGPKGFTNTFQEFDFRPGGAWRFVMHGPDGANYPNTSVFVEIEAPERIVFDHVSGPRFRMTMTFASHGAQTRLTWRMRFDSVADRDRVKAVVVPANEQNFDRLEIRLAQLTSAR